ncbi:MAG: hypothetical protein KJ587_07220 [Alphaproteobacteria bacterium]|nr:hypothetical protein [Alphaproteobacteria bacterium]
MASSTNTPDARALLQKAGEAAAKRDPAGMLEALFESRFTDGLSRRLQKQWGNRIPRTELDDCVALAIDAAYDAATRGKGARDLGAWLWKVANNTASDRWTNEYRNRDAYFGGFPEVPAHPHEDATERKASDELAEYRRREALRLAREMLPRIGTGQVVNVMEIVIDAAEQGVPDLPASTVAEALGITEAAARTLVSRGLSRLRREAERAGVQFPEEISETDPTESAEDRS